MSNSADQKRKAVALAGAVLLLSCRSTSAADLSTCGEPDVLTLCATVGERLLEVQRLAATNVLEVQPSAAMSDDAYIERLVEVPGNDGLEMSLRPSMGLQTTEVYVYSSSETLLSQPPLSIYQCEDTCGPWESKINTAERVIRIPADDLSGGNVVVVSAFVDRPPQEIGAVSWGVVLREDE